MAGRLMITFHGRTAIASAGRTALSRRSGRSVLDLAVEACRAALDDAGVDAAAVDGVVTYSMYNDSVPAESVGAALGAGDLTYVMDFAQGGQSACFMVMHAAMAIDAGLASHVLVYRAMNGRSAAQIGRMRAEGGGTEFRYPIGLIAYPQVMALWFRRYMIETGATEDDLAAVACCSREWARDNDRAMVREPLSTDEYFQQDYIAAPFRRADCTFEVDGAHAVLVTALDRARDLRRPPVVISGSGWSTHGFDLDMAGVLRYPDQSRNGMTQLAPRLWASAGLGPGDVDVVELYDCFSGVFLQNLEGLGFCEFGEAGRLVRSGATRPGGALPANTNGGLLAEGYVHGMNTVTEAVSQVQGDAGVRQVPEVDVAVACSGGNTSGSALVLTADR
jgi:acetyl-CoA acetyltransferase